MLIFHLKVILAKAPAVEIISVRVLPAMPSKSYFLVQNAQKGQA